MVWVAIFMKFKSINVLISCKKNYKHTQYLQKTCKLLHRLLLHDIYLNFCHVRDEGSPSISFRQWGQPKKGLWGWLKWAGRFIWEKEIFNVCWSQAIQGFKEPLRNLELNPEATENQCMWNKTGGMLSPQTIPANTLATAFYTNCKFQTVFKGSPMNSALK